MLEFCNIHPNMGCPLAPKSLEIPRQMGYLNQSYEVSDVPHDSINVIIGNVRSLL